MMLYEEVLAVSSMSGARLGIDGVVRLIVYGSGMGAVVCYVGRYDYSPSGYAIFGVIAISLMSSGIGAMVGMKSSSALWALVFCGAAGFLSAGAFLGFRFRHQAIIGLAAPVLLALSVVVGRFLGRIVVEAALS